MADLKSVISKNPDLSPMELLALASQLVGNLVALQDQTKMNASQAMELVAKNVEIGNAAMIDQLRNQRPAGHA